MANKSNPSGGIGFIGLLQIAFIVLKLIGSIGWSWWWVLSPIWITALVIFVCVLIVVIVAGVTSGGNRRF